MPPLPHAPTHADRLVAPAVSRFPRPGPRAGRAARLCGWLSLLFSLLGGGEVRAQSLNPSLSGVNATLRPGGARDGLSTVSIPGRSDAELGGMGTTEASLTRDADTAQQNFFRTFDNGILRVPKLGYGQGDLRMSAPLGPVLNVPLFSWSGKPEEAELKLGRLYLDIISLSASMLVSDNINLAEVGAQSDAIAVVRLQMRLLYQVSEAIRLAAAGTLIWLPFKGEVGFTDPLAEYQFSLAPLFLTQFTYDIPFNHFQITAFDNFTVQSGGLGFGRTFDLLGREALDLEDRAGRYSYRDTQSQGPTNRRLRASPSFRNIAGVNVSSLLPTVTRMTLGYAHENIWQARSTLGQASSSDTFTGELQSERENLRFKPYFSFAARHQQGRVGYDEAIRGGIAGPISDYLELRAEMGYFLSGDSTSEGYTWALVLAHTPRERFQHQGEFLRTVTYPDRSLVTILGYRARLHASPDLIFEVAAQQQDFQPIDNPGNAFGGKEVRFEGRANYQVLQRIRSRLGYAWAHAIGRAAPPVLYDTHTVRFELIIAHTPTFESSFLYQHEFRDSNRIGDSYVENVASLTLTRTF